MYEFSLFEWAYSDQKSPPVRADFQVKECVCLLNQKKQIAQEGASYYNKSAVYFFENKD